MNTLPHFISECGSRYGAPTGRASYGTPDKAKPGTIRCYRLPMRGGYDLGGAYWGFGQTLYVLTDDDALCQYGRSNSAQDFVARFNLEDGMMAEDAYPEDFSRYGYKPELTVFTFEGMCLDITLIIEAFFNEDDDDALMLSAQDFCLPGSHNASYSWTYAKEAVEDWRFSEECYSAMRSFMISAGMEEESIEAMPELELRALALQFIAGEFCDWRSSNEEASLKDFRDDHESLNHVFCGDAGFYLYIGI